MMMTMMTVVNTPEAEATPEGTPLMSMDGEMMNSNEVNMNDNLFVLPFPGETTEKNGDEENQERQFENEEENLAIQEFELPPNVVDTTDIPDKDGLFQAVAEGKESDSQSIPNSSSLKRPSSDAPITSTSPVKIQHVEQQNNWTVEKLKWRLRYAFKRYLPQKTRQLGPLFKKLKSSTKSLEEFFQEQCIE